MQLDDYLRKLVELEGSDLHIKAGSYPTMRINGELGFVGEKKLSLVEVNELLEPIISEDRKKDIEEFFASDFSHSIFGVARFRMNLSLQRGTYMLVARVIPSEIPDLEKMLLPEVLKDIIQERNGIVLVTGATGSGKSTTVAAMINEMNKTQQRNIISVEDPIEFLYSDIKSLISQKELGSDVTSFEKALKFALRQDPDVIFIGELRDRETVEAALKASETGHLVISTLHTINAYQTISRILDLFPEERHKQLRYQLSENLRSIVSQRLLPTLDGKRVAVNEVLRNTPIIKDCVLSAEGVAEIPKYLAEGRSTYKTQTFDQDIIDKFNDEKISYETALKFASVKKDIELLKRGINVSSANDMYNDMFE